MIQTLRRGFMAMILVLTVVGGQSAFALGSPVSPANRFSWIDYATIAIYFAVLVAMGIYFSRREKDTESFFLGGRRVPWWAVGISIFGTSLSAITYLSIPAKAYATDWVFILNQFGILLIAPIVVAVYLPRLRSNSVVTAYEYLEQRFNLATRIYGSVVFLLFQMGRVSIVLFLPALALSAATGFNIYYSIIAMGILAMVYTVMGGIEAVIWTDVLQAVVLITGAVIAFIIIVMEVEGGLPAIVATAQSAGKLHTFNWTWDYTVPAVWVCLIGSAFSNLYPSTADQTIVQRYLATASDRDAAKAVWTNALLTIPVSFLFFGLGTVLWVYFKSNPDLLDPDLQNDAILPLFIVERFPVGLKGLVIAGIFAAAMSSLDSSMNSVASVVVNDYYRRFREGVSEEAALRMARVVTVVFGIFGTGAALYLAHLQTASILDTFFTLLGLVGGGLAGIVALGVFTKRANGPGALTGAAVSAGAVWYAQSTSLHLLLYGMVGFTVAFAVGYAASLVFGER